LTTDDLDRLRRTSPSKRIPPRNQTKADILVYTHGGVPLALKDYAGRPWLVRQTLGRFLVRRESAAYRASGDLDGLPRFLGRVGPFALATAWIDARPLAECAVSDIPEGFFDRLEALVDSIHRRGVAHADLHRRDVLVGRTGSVHVVDLATAWTLGDEPGRLRRAIFERLCDQDRIAVARLRVRFGAANDPGGMDVVDHRAAKHRRHARRIKAWIDWMRRRER
jgi:hypothetical protein